MRGAFRLSMQWLHTWTGVLAGGIIFLIFFNGTAAYFRQEITTWMKPEIGAAIDPVRSVAGAQAFLTAKAPGAESWSISVPGARDPVAEVTWRPKPKPGAAPGRQDDDDDDRPAPGRRATIDATGLPLATRDTQGGDYFYQFHFALHYLSFFGVVPVGLASFGLMVALTTGLITHRRIFADVFTFRPRQGQRSWRDAHTTFAVLALPFHVMITYSGVAILLFFIMPWAVFANYASPQAFYAELGSGPRTKPPSAHAARLVPVDAVLQRAEAIWKGGRAERIRINRPGDASATIEVHRWASEPVAGVADSLTFNGVTGALIPDHARPSSAGALASSAMFGLHEAHFAAPALRWLLFACGASGVAMSATGLILWTEKRRRKLADPAYGRRGFRLVETLNVAVIAGYPAATAAYFWANRLLPLSVPSRAKAEVLCAFACWGAVLVWTALRPKRRAWIEVSAVAAVLFLALPILNAGTAARGTLASLLAGDSLYLGFNLVCLGLGLVFAAAALWTGRRLSPSALADREQVPDTPLLEGAE